MSTKKTVCEIQGHHYCRLDYVYAKDVRGTVFNGDGFRTAKKYMQIFCSRCGETKEIEIAPAGEHRATRAALPVGAPQKKSAGQDN